MAGPRKSTSSSSAKRAKAGEAGQEDIIIEDVTVGEPSPPLCTVTKSMVTSIEHLVVVPLGELALLAEGTKLKVALSDLPLPGNWFLETVASKTIRDYGDPVYELRLFLFPASENEHLLEGLSVYATICTLSGPGAPAVRHNSGSMTKGNEDGKGRFTSILSSYTKPSTVKANWEVRLRLTTICGPKQPLKLALFPETASLAKRVSACSVDPHPHNVRLIFPRSSGNLYLYANRDLLSRSSPYFKALFSSDFAEATPSRPTKRARLADGEKEDFEDSDDESDEVYADKLVMTSIPVKDDFAAAFHEIEVKEATYTTYRAVLLYLQSGYIDFAPLRSASLPLNPEATTTRSDAVTEATNKDDALPLPPSPKSVYRLAHFLSLTSLQSLALERIKSSLVIETAALELLTPTSLAYDEVQKVLIDYATQNIAKVEQTEAYKAMMNEIEEGGRPDAGPVLVKLLRAQRGR